MMHPRPHAQSGIALVVALFFLVVVTLLATSAVRFTSTSVGSALNEQLRVTAYANAQSVVEGVIALPANLPVRDAVETYCTPSVPDTVTCTTRTVTLPEGLLTQPLANNKVKAVVSRMEPLQAPPPRGSGASVNRFFGANFSVEASYDETDVGQGRNEVSEGLILILPNS